MRSQVSRPDRVLLTTDAVGGVWTYTLDLGRAYALLGIAVDLVIVGPPPSPKRQEEVAALDGIRLSLIDLPLDWMARDEAALRDAGDVLAGICSGIRPDIVHLNSPAHACSGRWQVPLVAAFHSCVATWWRAVRGETAMPEDFVWRSRCLHEGLANADAVIAPSRAVAGAASAVYYGLLPFKVVHNGRGLNWRGPGPRSPTVFTSGRLWDEGKNMAALDAAAARLQFPVYAAGPLDGPNGTRAELPHLHMLDELGAGEIADWLHRTTIFVSPSLYEPFGLGVLEAAQAGCALVLADIPTYRELWQDAALFVPPDEPAAIAAAIERLVADPARTACLAAAAATRALSYTAESMAAATLGVYAQVLGTYAVPPARIGTA